MHARAQLVDLVEHHHAAARAGFFECLNDVARQRANVGAPVPAHLGLVMHAAQRHAHKLAAQRLGDRLAQRCFAHTRRSHQAQNGAVACGVEFAHRQKFHNALLDFVQPKVIVVQQLPGARHVNVVRRRGFPGQFDQPVQVGAHH